MVDMLDLFCSLFSYCHVFMDVFCHLFVRRKIGMETQTALQPGELCIFPMLS